MKEDKNEKKQDSYESIHDDFQDALEIFKNHTQVKELFGTKSHVEELFNKTKLSPIIPKGSTFNSQPFIEYLLKLEKIDTNNLNKGERETFKYLLEICKSHLLRHQEVTKNDNNPTYLMGLLKEIEKSIDKKLYEIKSKDFSFVNLFKPKPSEKDDEIQKNNKFDSGPGN